jgi:hypothetical protein
MTALDAGWAEDELGVEAGAGSQSAQASFWDMMSNHRLRLEVSATLVRQIHVYPSWLGDDIQDGIKCRRFSRDFTRLQSQPVLLVESATRRISSKGDIPTSSLFLPLLAIPPPPVDFSARGKSVSAKTPESVDFGIVTLPKLEEYHASPAKMFVPSAPLLNFCVIPLTHLLRSSDPTQASDVPAPVPASAQEEVVGDTKPAVADADPAETRAQADKLIAEGKKAIALKSWDEGVAKYADALDLMCVWS